MDTRNLYDARISCRPHTYVQPFGNALERPAAQLVTKLRFVLEVSLMHRQSPLAVAAKVMHVELIGHDRPCQHISRAGVLNCLRVL